MSRTHASASPHGSWLRRFAVAAGVVAAAAAPQFSGYSQGFSPAAMYPGGSGYHLSSPVAGPMSGVAHPDFVAGYPLEHPAALEHPTRKYQMPQTASMSTVSAPTVGGYPAAFFVPPPPQGLFEQVTDGYEIGQVATKLMVSANYYIKLLHAGGYADPAMLLTAEKPPLWQSVLYKWLVARQNVIKNHQTFIDLVNKVVEKKSKLVAEFPKALAADNAEDLWRTHTVMVSNSAILLRQALEMYNAGATILPNYCTECVAGGQLIPMITNVARQFLIDAKTLAQYMTPEVAMIIDSGSAYDRPMPTSDMLKSISPLKSPVF